MFVVFTETKPNPEPVSYFCTAIEVAYTALQNALEQWTPLFLPAVPVLLRQLQHRVLHDIECVIVVTYRQARTYKRAPFDAGQEAIQCLDGTQCALLSVFR